MVHDIYIRTDDMDLAKESLPALVKEHDFWNSGIKNIVFVYEFVS